MTTGRVGRLGVRIQVRAPRREHDRLDAGGPQQRRKIAAEERAVVDQVAVFEQEAVEAIDERSREARHPLPGRLVRDAGDLPPFSVPVSMRVLSPA